MHPEFTSESGYKNLLVTIKQAVQSAQAKAALAVNSALIQLYWNLGKMIADNQALFEGRNNYVERLANDLKNEFPEMKGLAHSAPHFGRNCIFIMLLETLPKVVQLALEWVVQVGRNNYHDAEKYQP